MNFIDTFIEFAVQAGRYLIFAMIIVLILSGIMNVTDGDSFWKGVRSGVYAVGLISSAIVTLLYAWDSYARAMFQQDFGGKLITAGPTIFTIVALTTMLVLMRKQAARN